MVETSRDDQPTLGDLLDWLARRWLIVLVLLLAGGAGGWLSGQLLPATYTSRTLVQVEPVGPDPAGGQLNLDTEAQVVQAVDTAAAAGELMGSSEAPTGLVERLTVTVPPNTTFLEIAFEAGTPQRAQTGARSFAEAYLAQREQGAQQAIDDRIARLAEQIEELRAQGADDQVVVPLLNEALLLESETVRGGEVRSPASLPSRPSSPNLLLHTVTGLAAGLLLGIAAALLVHRTDDRIFRSRDLPGSLSDQVLIELRGQRPAAQVVGPDTQPGRQFSRLRNVMRASADATGTTTSASGVLLVCGVRQGSAAGFVTANLAAALARAGERVVVLACDPESTTFEALDIPAGRSRQLADLARGAVTPAGATMTSPTHSRISVLPLAAGEEVRELPAAEIMGVVLRLAASADRVIIEAAPMVRSIDAQALSVTASALLLVVEHQRTRAPEVAAAVRDFTQVHAPLAGLLLVPPERRRRRVRQVPLPPDSVDRPPAPTPTQSAPSFLDPPGHRAPGAQPPAASAPDDTVVLSRIQGPPAGDPGPGSDTARSPGAG